MTPPTGADRSTGWLLVGVVSALLVAAALTLLAGVMAGVRLSEVGRGLVQGDINGISRAALLDVVAVLVLAAAAYAGALRLYEAAAAAAGRGDDELEPAGFGMLGLVIALADAVLEPRRPDDFIFLALAATIVAAARACRTWWLPRGHDPSNLGGPATR